ncbi:MAG: SIS domain-containing protein [Anaerolineae bacterium]|nr:SIS domain-containing protein [Anaerolineae bacterium]
MRAVQELIQRVIDTQAEALSAAADVMARALQSDGRILLFGSGHSHMLAEEGHYRAGGIAAVVPILSTSLMLHESAIASTAYERLPGLAGPLLARYAPTSKDCLLVFSNSGVNAVPVEMAKIAREQYGMSVIAVIAAKYAAQAPLSPLGVRLSEIASVTIDNGGLPGDAVVDVGNTGIRVGPSSTVVGAFILNSLLTEVTFRLAKDKTAQLPVFISANMPNAAEHNRQLLERYKSRNPHF